MNTRRTASAEIKATVAIFRRSSIDRIFRRGVAVYADEYASNRKCGDKSDSRNISPVLNRSLLSARSRGIDKASERGARECRPTYMTERRTTLNAVYADEYASKALIRIGKRLPTYPTFRVHAACPLPFATLQQWATTDRRTDARCPTFCRTASCSLPRSCRRLPA